MSVKAKIQKDFLLTEANLELPVNLSEVDEMLKRTKSTSRVVALYNQGVLASVNLEQRTKMSDKKSEQVRDLLSVDDEAV